MKFQRWREQGRPKAVAFTGCCWLGSDSLMATDVDFLSAGPRYHMGARACRDVVPRVVPVYFRAWKGEQSGGGRPCEHGARPTARVRGNLTGAQAKELMGAEFHDFIDKPW